MKKVRILLADDHPGVRRGIRSLLEAEPQWEICFEAASGQEALEQARLLKPDIVLLDMGMPGMSGLEAARQILEEMPHTRVLLLSTDQSEELTEESRRSGADGVVLKSDARMLTAAIGSIYPRPAAVHLAGAELKRERHVAAFFRSKEERHRCLASFTAEGVSRGEKVLHIIDPRDHEEEIRNLQETGVEVEAALAQGRLEIVHWETMYLEGGRFDYQAMLIRLQGVLTSTIAEGFALTRVIGSMEWAVEQPCDPRELIEYEASVNDLLEGFDDVVVCAYDLGTFDADVNIDVMRAHPAVVVAGSLHPNPFYVPSGEMLAELNQRKAP
ncbi:MAG: sensory transduction histidine kinase [Acidobacteria bacterium]|nr:sensory transduction histidine kinase [Acidobacteriota bacterium]